MKVTARDRLYSQVYKLLTYSFFLMSAYCPIAFAVETIIPPTVEPENVSKALAPAIPEPVHLRPTLVPSQVKKPSLGPQAAAIKFKLRKIILEGEHVYSEQTLQVLYQNKLNTTISVAQLTDIVESITNYYRNNGYILSRAILPPQRIKDGIVRVQIIEGFISHVALSGSPKGAAPLIQEYGEKIIQSKPLNISALERYLRLANEVPGVTVKAVLEPSKTIQEASDLTLNVDTKTFTTYAQYDNYGTLYIGPSQFTGNVGIDSIFRAGDRTQVGGSVTSTMHELNYVELQHDTPLGSEGTRLVLDGNYTETFPGFTLAPLEVIGRTKTAYISIKHPWIRSRTQNLTIEGTFTYTNSKVTTLGSLLYNDHVRPIKLGVLYDLTDNWNGANLVGLDISKGLKILGADRSDNPFLSRAGGLTNFTKLGGQALRVQTLSNRLSAMMWVKGQYSFDPLLASEQFSFGGSQIGRGYDPSEIIGDRGLEGTAELRMDTWPSKPLLSRAQFYVFYDQGVIWNIKAIGQPGKDSAASAGAGVRMYINNYLSANVMAAQPLTHDVATEALAGNGRRLREFFAITFTM